LQEIRFAIAGCGLFAQRHLHALRGIPGARPTAVYDVERSRAETVAREFGIPSVCDSLEELCSHPEADVVDVVTPEHSHTEPALLACAASKHTFVEKPLALDVAECDRIIAAFEAQNLILMPGHILRFETRYGSLQEEVASGRLGRVISMQARRNRPSSLLARYVRVHPAHVNCIHDIDLMLWYARQPVRRVRGYERNVHSGPKPDAFWGVLEFEGGAVGIVEAAWLLEEKAGVVLDDAFHLLSSAGAARLSTFPPQLSYWRSDGFAAPDVSYDPTIRGAAFGALRDELAYFCECVRAARKPEIIRPVEARNAVLVALALTESAAAGCDVEIGNWA
jgi:predicted dehydrogenase